jgi:hypothetical protein
VLYELHDVGKTVLLFGVPTASSFRCSTSLALIRRTVLASGDTSPLTLPRTSEPRALLSRPRSRSASLRLRTDRSQGGRSSTASWETHRWRRFRPGRRCFGSRPTVFRAQFIHRSIGVRGRAVSPADDLLAFALMLSRCRCRSPVAGIRAGDDERPAHRRAEGPRCLQPPKDSYTPSGPEVDLLAFDQDIVM